MAGSIQIVGYKKINLKISTELNSIARKVFKILKSNFNINTNIVVNKNQMLKRNNSYVLTVTSEMGSEELMKSLGLLDENKDFLPCHTVPSWVYEDEECKKAFIRGAFLGGGSMLPRDPVMLLSYVNTQLRDRDASLDALCDREETDRDALCAALREIGYEYDAAQNRFV